MSAKLTEINGGGGKWDTMYNQQFFDDFDEKNFKVGTTTTSADEVIIV